MCIVYIHTHTHSLSIYMYTYIHMCVCVSVCIFNTVVPMISDSFVLTYFVPLSFSTVPPFILFFGKKKRGGDH